jgi:thioesterase domain-containing protein
MLLDPAFNDTSLQEMASEYLAQIRQKQPQGRITCWAGRWAVRWRC